MLNIRVTELFTAKLISIITNPVVLLGISLIIGNLALFNKESEIFLLFGFGAVPALGIYLLYIWKHRKNLLKYASVPRDKRAILFLTAIISYTFLTGLFLNLRYSDFWVFSSMVYVIFFTVFYLVNQFIDKASVHVGVFTFVSIYLTNRVSLAFCLLLVLVPFVGWARNYLHKHSWFQIMLGATLGMAIALLTWSF